MITVENFRNVANNANDGNKVTWTNEELLEAIKVHQCLVTYFSTRGEYLIASALRRELNSYESYVTARKLEHRIDALANTVVPRLRKVYDDVDDDGHNASPQFGPNY